MLVGETRKLTAGAKTAFVFAMAFAGGFMWRVRGDHGYGAMWGMFAVGVAFTLVIFAFFGNRKKMTYEAIPIAVILLGITNGAWGTLNSQMGGELSSGVPFAGEEAARTVSISPFSGLWIMLLLGFGLVPLFSLFIGSLFSDGEYGLKHYLSLIILFYATSFLFRFVIAHYILPVVNPQAAEGFAKGLADVGIELSPAKAYLKNAGSAAWAKKIPFGRNYAASVKAISQAAAALVSSIAVLVFMRDKITAFVSFAFNLVSALSITIADAFLIIDSDAGFLAGVKAPEFLRGGSWTLWEYFTGFLLGLGIALVILALPKDVIRGRGVFEYEEPFKNKNFRAFYGAVLTLTFTFGLTLARPAGIRISDDLKEAGAVPAGGDALEIIITAAICVLCLAFFAKTARKNVVVRGLPVPVAMRTEDFCMKAAPVYFGATGILYFFTGNAYIINFPFSQIKSLPALARAAGDGEVVTTLIMLLSFVLFYAFYFAARKKSVSKERLF